MTKAKILEIFQSIQGEGKYAGVRQVFVRFFECHMHCVWCDTPNSIGDGDREYTEYLPTQLWESVEPLLKGCQSVSLTGGEPLLQTDFIKEFVPYLKKAGAPIYLETSGVLYKELAENIDAVDVVAMDFKLPSSTKCRPFWQEHEAFLKTALKREVFIKAVISSETQREDVERSIGLISECDPNILFILQPNYFDLKNGVVKKCLEFQSYCLRHLPNVRIMPQMHKVMKLR